MASEVGEGDVAEFIVRSDGKAVWLNVDSTLVARCRVERVEIVDQRQTTDSEVLGYVATELRELRLKASQYGQMNKRKVSDARAERRIADSHQYQGRQEVWERVAAMLDKIIREYNLKERG